MARSFRLYEKKRGNRRTGSRKLGSAGEAVFFAALLLLGCGGLAVLFATWVVPEWRANHQFARGICTVLETQVGEKQGDDGALYRPEVQIEYEIDGVTYGVSTYDIHTVRGGGYGTEREDAEAMRRRFREGDQYIVYYDPSDPYVAVVIWGSSWPVWLSMIVPVSFVLIGGGGLVYSVSTWGKSAERRAAIVKRAAQLDPFSGNGASKPDFPHVPVSTNITDSPGTKLAFRLPVAGSPAWALSAWLVACLLWNGLVSAFVVIVIGGFLEGSPDWLLAIFTLPFVLIGIGLIAFFLRQLLVTTGIGPTLVEISDQPLQPGRRYRLFLSQTGRLKLNRLELLLVCDEGATFCHGTDARTETRRVCEQPLFRRDDVEVAGGVPFQTECELAVPAGAMHSFQSGHNEVTWRILVKGSPARWPDFERSFPVIVCPSVNGKSDR
ncbi:MAG TPA: DUF3592 domain-containing protein [Thermoguttaceae bacterium]|nr:DUF3592 domain-containing protein [Thermoguttaceae bacterium]